MITIQINGKTYKPNDLSAEYILNWLMVGFLEEVKENKEHHMIKCVRADLLREELEKRKQKMIEENWGPSYIEQVVWTLAVLDSMETKEPAVNYCDSMSDEERARNEELYKTAVVTSTSNEWTPTIGKELQVSLDGKNWTKGILEGYDSVDYEYPFRIGGGYWKYAKPVETKEEPVPPTDKGREQYISEHPEELQPQFTPGQMIEVSNDGEKWEKRTLQHLSRGIYPYITGERPIDWFLYARQPQEDIELLPPYEAPQMYSDGGRHKVGGPTLEQKQIEFLTSVVNQLIKANKKLGK